MAQKGPVQLDSDRLSQFIVAVNEYRQKVTAECEEITALCDKMIKDETLIGGNGEEIRNSFVTMNDGYKKLIDSSKRLVVGLNNKLVDASKAADSSTGEALRAQTAQTASKVGQFAKE